ncbi:TFIIH subunit Tfb4/p34 [Chytriomyces sp. MP71]|nr:TFIIH subunit Tfb4/p34 [Chytriomyces sp. MP71]
MDVLVIVLDLFTVPSPTGAYKTLDERLVGRAVDQILVFVNAHLALRFDGRVAVVAATGQHGSRLILASDALSAHQGHAQPVDASGTSGTYKQFKLCDDAITRSLKHLAALPPPSPKTSSSRHISAGAGVASAFSIALAYINRVKKTATDPAAAAHFQSRILVVSVSPDAPAEYIPIMNAIFAAKKEGVVVDVCRLLGNESLFLMQTAASTGGVFVSVTDLDNLITVLLHSFLPEPSIRTTLCLPGGGPVDFRASCFCHKQPCSIAFVCSVCLSS